MLSSKGTLGHPKLRSVMTIFVFDVWIRPIIASDIFGGLLLLEKHTLHGICPYGEQ
jgi:hypothetical protein